MKKFINYLSAFIVCVALTQCNDDFLNTKSPSNVDDDFVTSTPSETLKTLSWCYANYRQNCIMGVYRWNDPIGSDSEIYPEENSTNNLNAILRSDQLPVDAIAGGFNNLYSTLARAAKVAAVIAEKADYKADVAANKTSDWTHLYGEAITIKALCYFELVKHFGDVPYGYENSYVEEYSLTSRFAIYDNIINELKKVEPLMYKIGEGGVNAERLSRTAADALIGEIALYSGGYQTIRTDVAGLYGSLTFTKKGTEANGCVYARRTDYLDLYQTAKTYLQKAIDNKGTARLITTDDRAGFSNPFQRHFQYFNNLQTSPESVFEIGNVQGGQTLTTSEYPYAFGRPSDGGSSNAAPCKVFSAVRIVPMVAYGDYDKADKRRDVSIAFTGSNGDGNEKIASFVPGNKITGGISVSKWDDNRMNPPYVAAQRNSGMNWPMLRMADVILMLAEAKAELGEADAVTLLNQVRERAYPNNKYNVTATGQALKDAILQERKLELLGEGTRRWDLIRSGTFSERAIAVRAEMTTMINNIKNQGYHRFANGNEIPAYIWTKMVALSNPLTFDCTDTTNAALYPAWRGQYNYSTLAAISSKVVGTNHNVAIKGLFRFIEQTSVEATALKADGYVKTNWGSDIATYSTSYMRNLLSGITASTDAPRYYWPIPFETLSKSKGKITNGYGLAQK